MQTRARRPKLAVADFRRHLRVLEREVVRQLEGQTTCCGVTLAQCHVLLELGFAELSLTALAAALDLDTSTLSRTVETLVKAGLVERTVDPADRRSLRLTLSAKGRERVAVIDTLCDRYYTALLGRLSDEDQECVVRGIRLFAELMRSRGAEPPEKRPRCGPAKSCKENCDGKH